MPILIQSDSGTRPSSYDLHLHARQLRSEAIAAGLHKVQRMLVTAGRTLTRRMAAAMARRRRSRCLAMLDNRMLADIGFEREQTYVLARSGSVRRAPDIQR